MDIRKNKRITWVIVYVLLVMACVSAKAQWVVKVGAVAPHIWLELSEAIDGTKLSEAGIETQKNTKAIRAIAEAKEELLRSLDQLDALRVRGELLVKSGTGTKSAGLLNGWQLDEKTGDVVGGGAGCVGNYLSPATGMPIEAQKMPIVSMMPITGATSTAAVNSLAQKHQQTLSSGGGEATLNAFVSGVGGGSNTASWLRSGCGGNSSMIGDGVFLRPYNGGNDNTSDALYMRIFAGGNLSRGVNVGQGLMMMASIFYVNEGNSYDPRFGMASNSMFGSGRPYGNVDIPAIYSSGASSVSSLPFANYMQITGYVAQNLSQFTSNGRLSIPRDSANNIPSVDFWLNVKDFKLFSHKAMQNSPTDTLWSVSPSGMLTFSALSPGAGVRFGGWNGSPAKDLALKPGDFLRSPTNWMSEMRLVADSTATQPEKILVFGPSAGSQQRMKTMLDMSDAHLKMLDEQRAYIEQEMAYFTELEKAAVNVHQALIGVKVGAKAGTGKLAELIVLAQAAITDAKQAIYGMRNDLYAVKQKIHDELVRRDTQYEKIATEISQEEAAKMEDMKGQIWQEIASPKAASL
jgi:hypothetical protein